MTSPGPVTYEVTNVTQETKFGPGGTPNPGKNVTFKVSNGYTGTVFIPDTVFADTVAMSRIIAGEAAAVANAMLLRGTVGG